MKRDKNGRYTKEDGYSLCVSFQSIKKLVYWAFIFIVILPWLVIGSRFNLIQKIFEIFEEMLLRSDENGETTKKSGLFY